jgi:phosphofructokinase-like protein
MQKTRIGVLTGGGDCAGLNPAIKWIVKSALDERLSQEAGIAFEVLGIRDGWKGLMNPQGCNPAPHGDVVALNQEVVRTWDRYGGTMLGTSRSNPYDPKHNAAPVVLANIEKLGLGALIAIGGDDTQSVTQKLSKEGVNVIGIPKTIDKDLPGTDYTLGFETAVEVITQEIDRLRTTAGSHNRIFVVETMGRNAGWLALEGGEASGAYIILIPEYDFSIERVCELLLEGRSQGMRYDIVVVAEGAKISGGDQSFARDDTDSFGHKSLGGIAETVARQITKQAQIETRSIVLSHLQRGGTPCAYDRRMGRYFGIAAVDLVVNQQYGRMVSYRNGKICTSPIDEVTGKLSLVDVENLYDTERYNGRRTILRKV